MREKKPDWIGFKWGPFLSSQVVSPSVNHKVAKKGTSAVGLKDCNS